MVRTFYENMVVHKADREIISQVGGKRVVVTPDSIAEYLHYRRPKSSSVTYPSKKWNVPHNDQLHILTDDPNSYDIEDQRYVAGSLREEYRALNKILHCNISPFSNEKTPLDHDGELLVVFGSETNVVDWALRIWYGMLDFKDKGEASGKIPFPLMISALCEKAKCKPAAGDELVPGEPGPITASSWNKSKALSKPPRAETVGYSMPTAKKGVERVNQYCEILRRRQDILLEGHRRIEATQRREKRKAAKDRMLMKYIAEKLGCLTNDPYQETEEDKMPHTSDDEDEADGDNHEDENNE